MRDAVVDQIEREVSRWPGVTVTAHGAAFLEFRTGRREIGHLHGGCLADLPFPVRIRQQLVAEGRAELHRVHPASGWISVPINGLDDVRNVVALFRLNYERPWLARPSVAAAAP